MVTPRIGLVLLLGFGLGLGTFACRQAAVTTTTSVPLRVTATASPPASTAAPTTAAALTTTIQEERGTVVIHGVGDVNLDPSYIPNLAREGYEYAWSGLDGLFLDDDLTVVNLECSPSPLGSPEAKDFTFRCPEGLSEMADAGVDTANLGNNHSQDYGKEAMLDGRDRLRAVGIDPVGAGANADEAATYAPYVLNGWKVAVVGFGGVRPHDGWVATADQPGMADGDTVESMVAAVTAAEAWADWVVVSVHWGVELEPLPQPDDVERARALIAAGADVIFGHHSHRLQPFEMLDTRPVAWSLGNFVWPALSGAGAETAVARVMISAEGEISGCLIPAVIAGNGHPVLTGDPSCGP